MIKPPTVVAEALMSGCAAESGGAESGDFGRSEASVEAVTGWPVSVDPPPPPPQADNPTTIQNTHIESLMRAPNSACWKELIVDLRKLFAIPEDNKFYEKFSWWKNKSVNL